MNTLEGLLAGIVADPIEETRWLVVADWLEEYDDPRRAELLRLHRRMLAGVDRGGWIVEGGGTDPVFSHHSPHSTLHDLQALMVALIAEGVRPCVPQETISLPGAVGMTFSFIPPGSFLMGSDHPLARDEDGPLHRVTLTKGFFLGIHPVTQAQWRAMTGESPSHFKGDDLPVEQVSWKDCQDFCEKLTAHLGGRVTADLPSEAEWEYACRAGTTSEFHFGDVITADLVNYNGNHTWNGSPMGKDREETTVVGSFPVNPWGLFDMHGNVWEWCQDWYAPYSAGDRIDPIQLTGQSGEYRALRGGCWSYDPDDCRAATRRWFPPANRGRFYGFRCSLRLH